MFKLLLLIALIPALAMGQATPIRPCASGHRLPTQLRIPGCTSAPCQITQGQEAQMQVDFSHSYPANTLRPVVRAIVGASTVPYPLPSHFQNACIHLGTSSCPLAANTQHTYFFNFPISMSYPPIRVGVELTLNDELNRAVFCAVIDVQVRRA